MFIQIQLNERNKRERERERASHPASQRFSLPVNNFAFSYPFKDPQFICGFFYLLTCFCFSKHGICFVESKWMLLFLDLASVKASILLINRSLRMLRNLEKVCWVRVWARRFVTLLLLLLLMVFADFWMILFVVADFSPFVSAETCGCLSRRKDTTYRT